MTEVETSRTIDEGALIKSVIAKSELKEYRCNFCGILVFKGSLPPDGIIQINCPRDRCDRLRRHLEPEKRFLTFASL